jgi:hypothetical protein
MATGISAMYVEPTTQLFFARAQPEQTACGGPTMQGTNPFGSGLPFLKAPYGDQAADNQQILNGIQAQASGCVQ